MPATSRRGGAARESRSRDQTDGVGHLREARSEPHLVVVVVGLGVAGNGAGDDFGGCRSSGELGIFSRMGVEARGWPLHALRGAVSGTDMSVEPLRGRSHVASEHRRRGRAARAGRPWASRAAARWEAHGGRVVLRDWARGRRR